MTLKDCTNCKGTGWIVKVGGNGWKTIPCIHCNVRGKVSDQLFDEELSKCPPKKQPEIHEYEESYNKFIQEGFERDEQ